METIVKEKTSLVLYHSSSNPDLKIGDIDFNRSAGWVYPRGLLVTLSECAGWPPNHPYSYEIKVFGKGLGYSIGGERHTRDILNKKVTLENIDILIPRDGFPVVTNSGCITAFTRVV
ncbi:hypothetical protein HN832_01455 [archaeon]|jgi:hypothetical protein|nr:hypothetical protein [archaeon]MBT4373950.1 hypothetical protein [archaeon]MBT4532343.1 hypothetical protein [archaeon]MBT7001929.1 hypothetical protein [archaeon]MBT7282058.1 hypothetical protein [archaeon]